MPSSLRSSTFVKMRGTTGEMTAAQAIVGVICPANKQELSSDTVQRGFTALVYCFKFLRSQITADMDGFFDMFRGLLSGRHPPYIAQFAAESYAFLLRKLPDKRLRPQFSHILAALDESGDGDRFVESLAVLVFELVRHVRNTLHSRTDAFLGSFLRAVLDQHQPLRVRVWLRALELISRHVRPDAAAPLWQTVLDAAAAAPLTSDGDTPLGVLLRSLRVLADAQHGELLDAAATARITALAQAIMGSAKCGTEVRSGAITLLSAVAAAHSDQMTFIDELVFQQQHPPGSASRIAGACLTARAELVFAFCAPLLQQSDFAHALAPKALRFTSSILSLQRSRSALEERGDAARFLAMLLDAAPSLAGRPDSALAAALVALARELTAQDLASIDYECVWAATQCLSRVKAGDKGKQNDAALLACAETLIGRLAGAKDKVMHRQRMHIPQSFPGDAKQGRICGQPAARRRAPVPVGLGRVRPRADRPCARLPSERARAQALQQVRTY